MREAWRYTVDRYLDFRGVADENGNLYWFEMQPDGHGGGPIWLVSLTRDGTQRFRKQVEDQLDWVWNAALGNGALFVGAHATASAYDLADGHLIWTRSVANEVTNVPNRYLVNSIAVAPDGNPVFSFGSMGRASESAAYSWVIALDGATGATRWKRQTSAVSLATDSEGSVFFEDRAGGLVYSVDSVGQPRWSASARGAFDDLAVWNGVAVGDSVVRTADGTVAGTFDLGSQALSLFALLGQTGRFLGYTDYSSGPGKDFLAPIQTSPVAREPAIEVPDSLMYPTSYPTLMTDARVLVTRVPRGLPGEVDDVLTIYAPTGPTACKLQGNEHYSWGSLFPVVQPGRLISGVGGAGIVAFEAPGFEPEVHGWMTHRGSFARNGRAR